MKRAVAAFIGFGLFALVLLVLIQGKAQSSASDELIALAEKVNVQMEQAFSEASLAWIAANFEDVKASTQRVLNILVGQEDPDYNPIDSSADDATGLLDNLMALKTMLEETPWADFAITVDSIFTFSDWARINAKAVLEDTDEQISRVKIHKAEAFLRAALGCVDGLPTSGGAKTILQALKGS